MATQTDVRPIHLNDTNEPVTLSVDVGFGQPSSTDVFVDNKPAFEKNDSFLDLPIGTNHSLIGKHVEVRTSVAFLPSNPMQTNCTHSLNVGQPGSSVVYPPSSITTESVKESYVTTYIFIKK
jgi:hypothetical protein